MKKIQITPSLKSRRGLFIPAGFLAFASFVAIFAPKAPKANVGFLIMGVLFGLLALYFLLFAVLVKYTIIFLDDEFRVGLGALGFGQKGTYLKKYVDNLKLTDDKESKEIDDKLDYRKLICEYKGEKTDLFSSEEPEKIILVYNAVKSYLKGSLVEEFTEEQKKQELSKQKKGIAITFTKSPGIACAIIRHKPNIPGAIYTGLFAALGLRICWPAIAAPAQVFKNIILIPVYCMFFFGLFVNCFLRALYALFGRDRINICGDYIEIKKGIGMLGLNERYYFKDIEKIIFDADETCPGISVKKHAGDKLRTITIWDYVNSNDSEALYVKDFFDKLSSLSPKTITQMKKEKADPDE
jgi:hypothetical protein